MAVQLKREGWTQMFSQMRSPNGFLSRFFTIKPGGVYNGDKVAIDIQRFGEDVAIAIKKCTGPNLNDFDQFTTKEFTPPAYGEAFPLDVCDLLNRMAGVDPYTAAYTEYAGQLVAMMAMGFTLVDDKIKRAVELQASQVLQTGKLILTDREGATVYELDFQPKATHFPNVAVAWSDPAAVPLQDLEALAKVVRSDGKVNPDLLIMGESAISNFLSNETVIAQADNRRYELTEISPQFMDSGATMYGFYWIGSYRFQLWSYPDTYDNPANGDPVPYVGTNNVIMLSTKTRLDMASARVPLPLGPDPRVAGLLPGRMTSRDTGSNFDVTPNVYATPNGKQIMGELESRPLMIPVQIDGYACLTTVPA